MEAKGICRKRENSHENRQAFFLRGTEGRGWWLWWCKSNTPSFPSPHTELCTTFNWLSFHLLYSMASWKKTVLRNKVFKATAICLSIHPYTYTHNLFNLKKTKKTQPKHRTTTARLNGKLIINESGTYTQMYSQLENKYSWNTEH